ncbi:hypothetical protein [Fictibacillus phosphorivorans]|nr:hypothetical protein [Fictibacillus phosphorivorans]
MARSGRRLTVRPMESEQPGAEINYFQRAFKDENNTKKQTLHRRSA